nr:MAG TPA: hypothetical protein [Caudoviricetes sp.]
MRTPLWSVQRIWSGALTMSWHGATAISNINSSHPSSRTTVSSVPFCPVRRNTLRRP